MPGNLRKAPGFLRFMLRFNAALAGLAWLLLGLQAVVTQDWTIAMVPLLPTFGTALQWGSMRMAYGTGHERAPAKHLDYTLIAAMEREVWGQAFEHGGPGVRDPAAGLPAASGARITPARSLVKELYQALDREHEEAARLLKRAEKERLAAISTVTGPSGCTIKDCKRHKGEQ